MKKLFLIFSILCLTGFIIYKVTKKINLNFNYKVGQHLDSLNNVVVYYNGGVDNSSGRNTSPDDYNIGIKYQCVEFVKRYYYKHLNHKMPDAYGHAKDFYDKDLADGELNTKRNLIQYKNGSKTKPKPDDLIIFSGSIFNKYGHVAIISSVADDEIEIIQQNPGPFGKSRDKIKLKNIDGLWTLDKDRLLGWLRKE
ncbi:MAG: CHAP domain-containing protein [Flavobacterium sp.]|uniref:CHAP domain-containing protein n=1 Tax=Flavobacterium sp. TaxID=239 RepID=UPI0025BC5E9E|nr:CHAP domain-containing protein [Flavobacterium sp.]MCK6609216.1 CHAP domain-containing protein [Flavobacterium sp.]